MNDDNHIGKSDQATIRRGLVTKSMTKKGFTLIELIIAFAGGILILAGVLYLFTITRNNAIRGNARAELIQNSRIALEHIARDLRQAEELVTPLPENDSDPLNPPTNILEFQDGHNPETLTYIRYHLNGQYLYRELSFYSFANAPDIRVEFNTRNEFNDLPARTVLEDAIIAEKINNIEFFGDELITIQIRLSNNGQIITIPTTIFGRNTSGT